MRFSQKLLSGTLIRRYKRFLADVQLANGEIITIHCPNTGSMLHCNQPGSQVWFSDSNNPKRKYRHTWQMVASADGHKIGINTHLANLLVKEALAAGQINQLAGYSDIQTEVPYGQHNSRIDFLLTGLNLPPCYLEVKNVTLRLAPGICAFPDAVTARGSKHLTELMSIKAQGARAVLLFCVQHSDGQQVRPAASIDPHYSQLLSQAVQQGVEVIAYQARLSEQAIRLDQSIPVQLDPL
jgi:sugar fermentation stimulation protein A